MSTIIEGTAQTLQLAADLAAGSTPVETVPPRRRPAVLHLSRTQILDATAACLRESGYDGTTIRRISARLNCAVGSIYRYFQDKRALLSTVAEQRFAPVEQAVRDRVAVARTIAMYAHIAAAEPDQYRLMFWLSSISRNGASLPAAVVSIVEGWGRQLGDSRSAERLWSQLHGGIMLGIGPEDLMATWDELANVAQGQTEDRHEVGSINQMPDPQAMDSAAASEPPAPVNSEDGEEDLTLL